MSDFFSEQADFKNPCKSFVLPDVICSYCMFCSDLDLCRSLEIMGKEDGEDVTVWRCSQCSNHYDRTLIEQQLVQTVERSAMAYQLQDLRCKKTNDGKQDLMKEYSPKTASPWVCEVSGKDFGEDLITMLNIAKFHHLEWLEETVQSVLGPS